MRIHESGKNDLACTIDLDDPLAILLEPGVAQRIFALANGDNLASDAKHGGVLDDAEFAEFCSAPRAGLSGRRSQRQELADVDQQQRGLRLRFRDRFKLLV